MTGAGHGLGREIALELARIGCHVAVMDIDLKGAKETVRQINQIAQVKAKAYKVRSWSYFKLFSRSNLLLNLFISLKTNVTSLSELKELNKHIEQDFGPVTILVNNAGVVMHKNLLNPEPEEI